MFLYIFFAIVLIAWVWLAHETTKAPLYEEEQDIDDPTTTCWHDDEHYPDQSI